MSRNMFGCKFNIMQYKHMVAHFENHPFCFTLVFIMPMIEYHSYQCLPYQKKEFPRHISTYSRLIPQVNRTMNLLTSVHCPG